jgi:hypothetical protein
LTPVLVGDNTNKGGNTYGDNSNKGEEVINYPVMSDARTRFNSLTPVLVGDNSNKGEDKFGVIT